MKFNPSVIRQLINKNVLYLNKPGVIEWLIGDNAWLNQLTKEQEDAWGKETIGSKTSQWTTKLGEGILYDLLLLLNKTPQRVTKGKKGSNGKYLKPDYETQDTLYENKARTYTTTGTAGEKILGTPIKYAECKRLFNKPLFIVCMAYQEQEAEKSFQLFEPKSEELCDILKYYRENLGVQYIKASDLLAEFIKNHNNTIIPNPFVKPVIKWAGGKRSIMETLVSYFPKDFNNYYEPFLGGASVAMELSNKGVLENKNVYLSDIMEPLITLYRTLKTDLESLLIETSKEDYKNTPEAFDNNRKRFNIIKKDLESNQIESSALFLYLNKCCFNGMYRENSRGDYNVPFGRYKEPCIFNKQILKDVSQWLNHHPISIKCCSYQEATQKAKSGDFIYMDPPYHQTFSGYNKTIFGDKEHLKLAEYFNELTQRGCKVALSNSNTEYIRSIYSKIPGLTFIEIPVKRLINSKIQDRGVVKTELLIVNYKM